ncbi:class IV adenylate cyclase [Candidatus Dependentiae bacterium]|nr:class IV adenylate cyclase [Candidatus Dependentiae bacterium]
MQKEVEIKIKIDAKQQGLLKKWLESNAKFIGDLKITDYYLNNPESSFYFDSKKGYKEALNFLRLRKSEKKNFITFKKRNIDENDKTISVEELETTIGDINKALQIFRQLNLLEITEIQKQRTVYNYDIFEIVFDKVERLGDFVEIELKNYSGDVNSGIQKIYKLLKSIGIKQFIEYDRGYITMFLNPDYYFGKEIEL